MRIAQICRVLLLAVIGFGPWCSSLAQARIDSRFLAALDKEIVSAANTGNIPGLTLVIVEGDKQYIRSYGYADAGNKVRVTPNTLFQLGSCSKAFTALAAMVLARDGKLELQASVSDYLPWFLPRYKDSLVPITINQLLHHTSGIPWQTLSDLPQGGGDDALEQTVKKISGTKLHNLPGKKFEYATVNYDILALIIQKVSGQSFETYLQKKIFDPLGLASTTIGAPLDSSRMAVGYKIGFFHPIPYTAPVYKGNNAAGYVISDGTDMARWLRFQMGLSDTALYGPAGKTHLRDETVALHGYMSSYAMGWEVSLSGNGQIGHGGLNPNFTSYVAFQPGKKMGIVLLTNSNSSLTQVIGDRIMKRLQNQKIGRETDPGDSNDRLYSSLFIVLCVYTLVVLALLTKIVSDIAGRRRRYQGISRRLAGKYFVSLLPLIPVLYAIYLLPGAMVGFSWQSVFVWSPVSFQWLIGVILVVLTVSYLTYGISLCYPEENKFRKALPPILLISILSGVANMILIVLVTSSLDSSVRLRYLVFYYFLVLCVYLFGRRFVQISLIRFARELIYELRIKLIDKIFSTSYQKFENIDRGRVYTALNDDVEMIGGSADQCIALITNFFTTLGAFLYLASIAFWTTVVTVLLILFISLVYYLVSRSTTVYFEEARDTRNVFILLVNGIVDGFKEISLHRNKKQLYKADIADTAHEYKEKLSIANIRFTNAFLIGESLLILLLGVVVFAMPRIFPGIHSYTIMSFVIVVLYLIGPINGILSAVPSIMQLRIAWRRIQEFLREIPANLEPDEEQPKVGNKVKSFRTEGVLFRYAATEDETNFEVGPIDLEVKAGEILFIIGGNGSGKTTLAKLLTGLYKPDEGRLLIDDLEVSPSLLGEYFSTVFSPAYLFEKMYDIDTEAKSEKIREYLEMLDLQHKVKVVKNKYSTIALSNGQRKRLALLQCYLEDYPICLFDEWAAEQDPEYRYFFYRTLLPQMKKMGKIIIAITHDYQYFDVADKVLKMQQGKMQMDPEGSAWYAKERYKPTLEQIPPSVE